MTVTIGTLGVGHVSATDKQSVIENRTSRKLRYMALTHETITSPRRVAADSKVHHCVTSAER